MKKEGRGVVSLNGLFREWETTIHNARVMLKAEREANRRKVVVDYIMLKPTMGKWNLKTSCIIYSIVRRFVKTGRKGYLKWKSESGDL